MMTSVTLPSSSGPTSNVHGGYATTVAPSEENSSELEFEIPRTTPVKRCLTTPSTDSCKKRRKQSTPIRISATELESTALPSTSAEGRPPTPTDTSSTEPEYRCPMCQLYFDTSEQIQSHIITEHSQIECKREPEDFPTITTPTPRADGIDQLSIPRPEIQWMGEMQGKEWMASNMSMPFNPSNSMFMSLPQFSQADNIPRQSIRIFNPDAYCDLCNKEFCNKYFLKTHKANKHGIYTDNVTSDSMINPVNIPSYAGNAKFPTSVPSVETSPLRNELKTSNSAINPFSDIYQNQFNKYPKITPKQMLFNEGENNENTQPNGVPSSNDSDKADDSQTEKQLPSPRDIKQEPKNEPESYYDASKMSPISSRELEIANRLRRIGVMNPKAFCEICCKEYCNKYFLRTHKMKRHGIYIPDDRDGKEYKIEGMGHFPWGPNVQTSPLNLIMGEQASHDRKTTSPNDIRCDLCGIKFQNASLAQLHNVTLHGKAYAKDHEQSDGSVEDFNKKTPEAQNSSEKSLNAEAISEDLQKLQTMILQLNDLDVTKVSTSCSACNKEFENRYYLHAHMMTEHGVLMEDISEEKVGEPENSSNNNTMCDLCGKDVQNVDEMKKHIMEFHSNIPSSEALKEFNGFNSPDKSGRMSTTPGGQIPERKMFVNVTPTSSYCEICNKELCNKYFMKTHMQRMHGIEIENGSQIGGVVCDICNKELCSKYFLRVHKHNTHGIVEYGASLLPQPTNLKSEGKPPVPPLLMPETDPSLKPADLSDLSHRYFTHFTEVCTICSRRFRSTKWLKAHLLSDHGQAGADKWAELEQQLQHTLGQKPGGLVKSERSSPTLKIPNSGQENQPNAGIQNVLSSLFGVDETNAKNYQCSFCPFTTPLLPLLFVHERSHSINSSNSDGVPLKCPVCPQSFLQPELLQHHIFTQHPFLPLPPFFNGQNLTQGEISKEPSDTEEEESKLAEEEPASIETKQKSQKNKESAATSSSASSLIKHGMEISAEIGQSLKDVAIKAQLPATYALPQSQAVPSEGQEREDKEGSSTTESTNVPGYVMQAFLLEEAAAAERRVVPAVVFLPVLQKQPAPLSVTFTLTPA